MRFLYKDVSYINLTNILIIVLRYGAGPRGLGSHCWNTNPTSVGALVKYTYDYFHHDRNHERVLSICPFDRGSLCP